jgi:hypothetical protein
MACSAGENCCNGGEYCACKKYPVIEEMGSERPSIYSNPLPPYPTIGEIRLAIRDELRKAGVI